MFVEILFVKSFSPAGDHCRTGHGKKVEEAGLGRSEVECKLKVVVFDHPRNREIVRGKIIRGGFGGSFSELLHPCDLSPQNPVERTVFPRITEPFQRVKHIVSGDLCPPGRSLEDRVGGEMKI